MCSHYSYDEDTVKALVGAPTNNAMTKNDAEAALVYESGSAYYTQPYLSLVLWGRRIVFLSRYRYDCLPAMLRSAADDCLLLEKKD